MILLLILLVSVVFLFVGYRQKQVWYYAGFDFKFAGWVGFWLSAVFIVFGLLGTMCASADLDAFYLTNNDIYADAIQVYDSYAAVDESALISLASAQYNKDMGDFIRDYRNSVIDYNRMLYSKRQWEDNWFNGLLLVQPSEAKPIKLLKRSK